ncbi:MAG TPA: polyprenyl synthetase family protein, partial [Chloroflexota bacterium]
ASRRLCEGQYLDLAFELRDTVTIEQYLEMIEGKTAALLEAACLIGGIFAGADAAVASSLARYGREMGLAFQMRDDYLGIWGDPAETGKPAADDVAGKKKTLPILYALDNAPAEDRLTLRRVMSGRGTAPADDVAAAVAILARCGAGEHTQKEAERYSNRAVDALSTLADSPARRELEALCLKLAGRRK